MTPDPESSSPEMRSHLDWDLCSEVPTEVGDEVYGRYVHRFPSMAEGNLWACLGWLQPLMIGSLP